MMLRQRCIILQACSWRPAVFKMLKAACLAAYSILKVCKITPACLILYTESQQCNWGEKWSVLINRKDCLIQREREQHRQSWNNIKSSQRLCFFTSKSFGCTAMLKTETMGIYLERVQGDRVDRSRYFQDKYSNFIIIKNKTLKLRGKASCPEGGGYDRCIKRSSL